MVATTKNDLALIAHLLRRAGFGAAYDKVEEYAAKGYEATVEDLLSAGGRPAIEEDLILRRSPNWTSRLGLPHNQTYWLYRMINSQRPLEEKVALFWHGVHCTGDAKVDNGMQMGITIEMFRRYGLGSFRDLLVHLAKDPGMVFYLDNNISHKGAINENWGRELLELFSMGVGNYTEDDVKEASRAFTGWTLGPAFPPYPYGRIPWVFLYDLTDHDEAGKSFLGRGGRFNGEDIIDIVCQQPATAQFIARHLYNFFVADEAPVPQWGNTPPRDPQAIQTLVNAYFECNYDIRSVLRVLFNSDFFKRAQYTRVKSPTEVVVETARLLKAYHLPGGPDFVNLVQECGYMGQDLLSPPTVEGWHTGQEWIDSGTLVERVNFVASQLGDISKPGVRDIVDRLKTTVTGLKPEDLVQACSEQLGFVRLSEESRKLLIGHAQAGGKISTETEDFDRRTAELLRLIGASKEYQFG